MLARIRAQAQELQAKAIQASDRGDHETFKRCHNEWKRLMRYALAICV